MNNKKIIRVVFSIFLVFACWFLLQTMSQAASFSASISKTTVTVGDTFTVTVKANNAAGMYSVSNSNSNVSLSSGSKSEFLENGSATIKFKATKAGSVTITAKAVDMTDLDNSDKTVTGTKTFNVTIKAKSSSSGSDSGSSSSSTKPTFTSTNKKVYAKDSINLRSSWSTSSSATPVSKGTEMTLTGTSTKSVNGYVWYRVSYKGATKYVASNLVTTTKPADNEDKDEEKDNSKATNTNLKSLTVTPTGLSPVFATGTTEYTMTVGSDIDKVDVKAVAEDANATVKITGNEDLKIGTNKIAITVIAGEETKIYNITVTKEDKKQLQLSELLVEGLPLEPEFDSNIYEYTLTLDRGDVSEVNITATPNEKNAEIEIVGNTNLQPGENVITILVKSEDGEDISTYQVTVMVPEMTDTAVEENTNKDLYMYIGIGVGAFLVLIIIIVIIRKRRNTDDEDYMYYDAYNPNGNDVDNKEDRNDSTKQETTNTDLNSDLNLDELPKLEGEDLPKSLRKKEKVMSGVEVNSSETREKPKTETMSERAKRIEEFYNTQDVEVAPRKRGKHSK